MKPNNIPTGNKPVDSVIYRLKSRIEKTFSWPNSLKSSSVKQAALGQLISGFVAESYGCLEDVTFVPLLKAYKDHINIMTTL